MRSTCLGGVVLALSCFATGCDSKPAPETSSAISVEVAKQPAKAVSTETNATPSPPAGPVPIPYPNVAAEGAAPKNAKVSGKEVVLKNGSQLRQTTGD